MMLMRLNSLEHKPPIWELPVYQGQLMMMLFSSRWCRHRWEYLIETQWRYSMCNQHRMRILSRNRLIASNHSQRKQDLFKKDKITLLKLQMKHPYHKRTVCVKIDQLMAAITKSLSLSSIRFKWVWNKVSLKWWKKLSVK